MPVFRLVGVGKGVTVPRAKRIRSGAYGPFGGEVLEVSGLWDFVVRVLGDWDRRILGCRGDGVKRQESQVECRVESAGSSVQGAGLRVPRKCAIGARGGRKAAHSSSPSPTFSTIALASVESELKIFEANLFLLVRVSGGIWCYVHECRADRTDAT